MLSSSYLHIIVVISVCMYMSVGCVDRSGSSVNPIPGIKLTLNEKTMNYVMTQSLDWMEEHINTLDFPEIKKDVKTPLGTVEFTISDFKMGDISPKSPSMKIIIGYLQFTDPNLSFQMTGDWKWKDKTFPYPSDSGSFDLTCNVDVTSNVGAELDPSTKSGIKVDSNYFSITFKSLDITVHGGESWLYNILITVFKPIFEATLSVVIQDQMPSMIVTVCGEVLNALTYDNAVLKDVFFSFIGDEVKLDPDNQSIILGVEGKFHSSEYTYPILPEKMPDELTLEPMVSLLLSEYSVNSAGYVFDKSGLIEVVLTQKDIPSKVPIKLNTTYFELIVPGLYKVYGPNKLMQLTLDSDSGHVPFVSLSSEDALSMFFDVDTVFQVVLDNGTISDAFTLSLDMLLSGNISVETASSSHRPLDGGGDVQYRIIGNVGFKDANMTVSQTNIGKINLLLLETTVKFLLHYVIVPLIDEKLKIGIPLPAIPYFQLYNPVVHYHDQFAEIRFDFTFEPPARAMIP